MSGASLQDAVVVVTGAGGPAGQAVVRRLLRDGARVVGADTDPGRLDDLRGSLDDLAHRFGGHLVDLLDEQATRAWAKSVEAEHGRVDGLVHLVGGWRGGRSFLDNTTADAQWLHELLVRTLQHVTLAFHDALERSDRGRFAIVSATAAGAPTAGNAGYAAAKAAAEAWTLALADSFRTHQSGRTSDPLPQHSAAAVLVVKALVNDAMRAERPDAAFPGYTDVSELAGAVADLWATDAATLNGRRIVLAR